MFNFKRKPAKPIEINKADFLAYRPSKLVTGSIYNPLLKGYNYESIIVNTLIKKHKERHAVVRDSEAIECVFIEFKSGSNTIRFDKDDFMKIFDTDLDEFMHAIVRHVKEREKSKRRYQSWLRFV